MANSATFDLLFTLAFFVPVVALSIAFLSWDRAMCRKHGIK